MFDKLFKRPFFITRQQNAPYRQERERFLARCEQQGYSRTSMRHTAWLLLMILESGIHPDREVTEGEITLAARRWFQRQPGHSRMKGGPNLAHRVEIMAIEWTRFLGLLRTKPSLRPEVEGGLRDFELWMREERGLSPKTIRGLLCRARQFLTWVEARGQVLPDLKVSDVDAFLSEGAAKGWRRTGIATTAQQVRQFLRHAGAKGWCAPDLYLGVTGPSVHAQESLPQGPSWDIVEKLLKSASGKKPKDIRDRAIIILLAVYGLRAIEVAQLRLDDVDWERDQISVLRAKRRGRQLFPLTSIAGEAISRYLRRARPRWPLREVFLPTNCPMRPLSAGAIVGVVACRMKALGVDLPHHGAHCLRHACAQRLTAKGFSLKEIGDQLGHRSARSTQIYSKIDLNGLREVAEMDLGGVI